jgi:hypothetical protein
MIASVATPVLMDVLGYHNELLKTRFSRGHSRFVEHDDCVEVFASNGGSCFLDRQDQDLVKYIWYSNKGYFGRTTSRSHPTMPLKSIYMSRIVLERSIGRLLSDDEYCDHIDWNKANNRRINLRVASKFENACNVRTHSDRPFEQPSYKGVTRAVDTCRVQIQYTVTVSESGFCSAEDAARRYDELAAKHHGRFAVFNFPQEWVFDLLSNTYVKLDDIVEAA